MQISQGSAVPHPVCSEGAGNHQRRIITGLGSSSESKHCMEMAVRTPRAFSRAPPRTVARATPNLGKTLHFVDMT